MDPLALEERSSDESSKTEAWPHRCEKGSTVNSLKDRIHPVKHAKFRDKAQRPSVVSVTTLWTAEIVGELSAQLNLTRETKRKRNHT